MSETETSPDLTTAEPQVKKPKLLKSTDVSYRSVNKEPTEFSVMEFRGCKQPDGHLVWDVPAKMAERFERHIFFAQGRIVKV